jgi:autotransporter-associated beta strand protein
MPTNLRRLVLWLARVSVACAAAALWPSTAAAQVVTNTLDNGSSGSLRYEVANYGGGNITWSPGGAGTIALASALDIGGSTTLDATSAGADVLISQYQLVLNGGVTFANSGASAFSVDSDVSGAGSLTKTGIGIVYLTGANSYTGGTILNTGILNVNSNGALGNTSDGLTFNGGTLQAGASFSSARSVSLNASGTFDTNGYVLDLTGVVGGTGQLIVSDSAGGGLLELRNTGNSYSGGTLFESGTLNIDNDAELGTGNLTFNGGALQTDVSLTDSHNITLSALGGIFDTAGTTSTLAGLIEGSGALTKISSGTLVLSGANTYTGGTVIRGGVLAVYNDGNLGGNNYGSITLNGGTLQTIDAFTDDTHSVYLGAAGGTIDTDGNHDSFYGVFADTGAAGSLTKIGDGTLTLYGANTYSGGTTVSVGTLQMGANNVMPSGGALNVASGATFDMNGFNQTNALGNVLNNGLFNAGSGQLVLGGGYSGTGTLALTLKPGFTNVSAGNMTLTGGTLALKLADPGVKTGDTFTPITWTAASGQFASVVSPAAVELVPTYNAGGLLLTAQLIPFASLAATPNQAAVGGALESLRTQAQNNPTGPAGAVIGSLYTLNVPQIQAAYDQIGPIALASMSSLGLAGSSVQAEALGRRMTALDSGAGTGGVSFNSINGRSSTPGALLAAGGVSETDPFDQMMDKLKDKQSADVAYSPWGFFASGVGTTGHLNTIDGPSGAQPGYDYLSGGLVLGGDYRVADNLAVGLTGGYLYGHANVYTAQESTVDNNSARAGVYATGREGAWRGDLYVGGALDFFSTSRGILFGSTQEAATANPTGDELNANADLSYDFETEKWGVLSPFAGINVDRLMIHSFSESGAGALDLNVGAQTDQSLRSTLGLRQSFKTVSEGVTFQSHWSLGWLHEFSDQSRPIDAQLASGAGSVFTVETAGLPRDGALAGAGFVMSVDKDTSFNLDYSADVREHFIENVFNASLRLLY